ncbi:putative potassium transporter 12 [Quercus suber]|uniref:Potassium transporter 12 n=1 Tax=Quercus suber TaxID=58331 RepID=A0AAW0KUV1_QUESU
MEEHDGIEESSVRLTGSSVSGGGGGSDSRWVDGSEVDSESPPWSLLDESETREEQGSLRRRLVKKARRVDSFDVEAMEIAGDHGHHTKDISMWHTIALAFQTLGVVYGDMGTSPLYVFAVVFNKVPIKSDVDILGALSLVMYTIALLPLVKYVFVVLKANDNGEGGTFALYSLICRYANVNMLPNRQTADEQISMMSAVSGLEDEIEGISTGAVVVISIVILVCLFSIQQFGTGKVGFLFSPVLALWFFSLGSIGIYNIVKYDITIVRAFNPVYIYLFFKNNSTDAWSALGGCVLCITGAEAMFADLGHFSVRAIQIAFTCVVFPCLLLAYMGQAAYVMKSPKSVGSIFYASVPGDTF